MSGPDPRDLVGEEWEPEWLRSAGEGTWDPQDDRKPWEWCSDPREEDERLWGT